MFAGEGEPLLHPEMSTIVNDAKCIGLDVSFTTNGTLMTPKFLDECQHNIDWIKISVNAGVPETYANIHKTKTSDWDKVWQNVTYACIQKEYNTCTIGVQMVILPENINEVEELALTAKLAGVDYLVAKPYSQHLSSITRKYANLNYEGLMEKLQEVSKKFSDEKFQLIIRDKSMSALQEERSYQKCYSTPFMWAYIMATGDVYGCSAYLLDERFRYGNINNDSFSDIWTCEKRQKAIEFVENELDIRECRKNCRMDKVNRYLWDIKNPGEHQNFI
jgi:radical SAM protein with 4Fe4S-binding SPASM domain